MNSSAKSITPTTGASVSFLFSQARHHCTPSDSERASLAQLTLELASLHQTSKAALGAGRKAADPLAADKDVREAALAKLLAQLHARRAGLRTKEEPLRTKLHLLELAACRLQHPDGLRGEGRERVGVDDDRCRTDSLLDLGLHCLLIVTTK